MLVDAKKRLKKISKDWNFCASERGRQKLVQLVNLAFEDYEKNKDANIAREMSALKRALRRKSSEIHSLLNELSDSTVSFLSANPAWNKEMFCHRELVSGKQLKDMLNATLILSAKKSAVQKDKRWDRYKIRYRYSGGRKVGAQPAYSEALILFANTIYVGFVLYCQQPLRVKFSSQLKSDADMLNLFDDCLFALLGPNEVDALLLKNAMLRWRSKYMK